jgi:hypothetical protein
MNNKARYSVVITTFDKRYEECLVPLLDSIKNHRPEIEVIITINGRCRKEFDEKYRQNILNYISTSSSCFPIMFPNFQSLAKMWNRGILSASNELVLVLNDDLHINSTKEASFFDELETKLTNKTRTFRINGSFSHFVINKKELIEVGFFDERLLGLGEEDGDFYWRYYEKYGLEIESIDLSGIENIQSEKSDDGYIKGIRTAAKFNRDFIKKQKYKEVLFGGYRGMFDKRVKKIMTDESQYPYEEFYRNNRQNI